MEPARATGAPARRLTSKGERRLAHRRASSSLASANDVGSPEALDGDVPTLQARVTYELYSGNPSGDTDSGPGGGTDIKTALASVAADSEDQATQQGALEARVICELYSGNPSGDTDAKVTFSVVEPTDASTAEGAAMMATASAPTSGNPSGDTDRTKPVARRPLAAVSGARRQPRSVVVQVHIPRGATDSRVRVKGGGSAVSRLMPYDAQPAGDHLTSPT